MLKQTQFHNNAAIPFLNSYIFTFFIWFCNRIQQHIHAINSIYQ